MNDFVLSENKLREERYRKSEGHEQMFLKMNNVLEPLEKYNPSNIERPTLFIFGLPRSGTTLLYQVITQALDIGYVNNLIARFWKAPIHGIALSQKVLLDSYTSRFQSDFGKTEGPSGPHEFAYFWQRWLNIDDTDDMIKFNEGGDDIDWNKLRVIVQSMQDEFGKGIVFKTMYVANHIRRFEKTFIMPLFIYIERDPADVGLSILKARKAYYGNKDEWWSTYPPDYHDLKDLPFSKQIAGQVSSLRKTYKKCLELIDSNKVIKVTYEQLCFEPQEVIKKIVRTIRDLYGYEQAINDLPMIKFDISTYEEENLNKDGHQLLDDLQK